MRRKMGARTALLYAVLFFFIFGLSAGAFTEIFLEDSLHSEVSGYIQGLFSGQGSGLTSTEVFWNSLKGNGILLALMAAGGVTVIGFPMALLVLAYKGASLGFTFALVVDTMGAKGLLSSLASMLFQNMILIPMFFIFCFLTLNFSFDVLFGKDRRLRGSVYQDTMSVYGVCFLGAVIALVIGCFVEAYFSTALMQLM